MPWLEPSDMPTCRAWAQIEVLADMAHVILGKEEVLNSNGEPRRLFADFRQLRQPLYARKRG